MRKWNVQTINNVSFLVHLNSHFQLKTGARQLLKYFLKNYYSKNQYACNFIYSPIKLRIHIIFENINNPFLSTVIVRGHRLCCRRFRLEPTI